MSFKIGKHFIAPSSPTFIIAEAGVNHNGDVKLAEKLIYKAKEIGADCVKFQTFKAERVITKDAPKAKYQLETTSATESQFEMLQKLELDIDVYRHLILLCVQQNILFLSTPYNKEDVDFLDELGVPAFKLASIHSAEPSFLQYVARKGKPMIVATGMATLAEVDSAVRAIRETGNEQFVILQCTTNYPSKVEDANLLAMQTMYNSLKVMVGYSDHTQTDTACMIAVALGACVIEKHFTLDRTMPGPDHAASADPDEFARLVHNIRETEVVLGSALKQPCQAELDNIQGMRRSIVAKQDIVSGSVITEDNLTFKRPGTGIKPALIKEIIGRVANQNITQDSLLDWSMLGHSST